LLAQHQVRHPAPADMLTLLPAMVQNVAVVAAGVFESISEDREAVECALVVDRLDELLGCGREPGGIECDGAEGVAEDAAEQGHGFRIPLRNYLCLGNGPELSRSLFLVSQEESEFFRPITRHPGCIGGPGHHD